MTEIALGPVAKQRDHSTNFPDCSNPSTTLAALGPYPRSSYFGFGNSCSLPGDTIEADRLAPALPPDSLPIWHCSMQRLLVSLPLRGIVTVALILILFRVRSRIIGMHHPSELGLSSPMTKTSGRSPWLAFLFKTPCARRSASLFSSRGTHLNSTRLKPLARLKASS